MRARSRLRALAAALALAACAYALAGCAAATSPVPGADAATPHHGGRVVIGWHQEPDLLNGRLVAGGVNITAYVNDPMWDKLIEFDRTGQYVPELATRVPTLENGLVRLVGKGMQITVPLDPRARWSDGVPLTCDDVRFTWQVMLDPRWMIGSRAAWQNVTSVSCPTPHAAVFDLATVDGTYRSLIAMAPLPRHDVQGKDFNTYHNDRIPVSSGPFVFKRWKRGVYIELVRNPHYWRAGAGQRPYLDSIVFRFLGDTNTVKVQLRSGEVDLAAPPFDTNSMLELGSIAGAHTDVAPQAGWEQVGFNSGRAPMDDVDVRRAVAHAIDRRQLVDSVLRGNATPLQSFLVPSQGDFAIPAWQQYTHDPAQVAQLLTRAGYTRQGQWWTRDGRPLRLQMVTTAGNALRLRLVQVMQQQLAQQGIALDISFVLPEVLFSTVLKNGTFDMALWTWGQGHDPDLGNLFRCDAVPTRPRYEGSNYYRYCNAQVTQLWRAQKSELDHARRVREVQRLQRMMAADAPLLPLYQAPETLVHADRVHGVVQNPIAGPTWNAADWWVDP